MADPLVQIIIRGAGAGLAVASWKVTEFSDDDEDDATPVTDPGQLESGCYAVQDPGTPAYLYRNRIEDYSLRPKVVAVQPPGLDPGPPVIQVVGESS